MASATAASDPRHHPQQIFNNLPHFIQSTSSNLSTFLTPKTTPSSSSSSSSSSFNPPAKVVLPLLFGENTKLRLLYPPLGCSPFESTQQPDSLSSPSEKNNTSSKHGSGFPSTVKISGLKSVANGAGPAFVGQVFSMCDLSGTGLMAVSTHFDIPFLSKRTPEWLKKMFATVTKSERNGPVFRFFMDLGDAVSYVKRLNIPSGIVGACRLDLAYEHFKEKPHLFQFVPNEKQVKEANKLLKGMPWHDGKKKVEGVPVFSAQNLDIAIATTDGIKWYTPYFFDKNMLDNILEESVDQHFHSMIQTRNMQRRRDVIDDNLAAEVVEEMGDSMWDPPEVQEVLDEVGRPGIPLSVLSKAAEIQLLYTVDKVLLGKRWMRKVTGIQPKFPYMVDSFEKRSAASFLRATSSNLVSKTESGSDDMPLQCLGTSEDEPRDIVCAEQGRKLDLRLPFKDWFDHPWLKQQQKLPSLADKRVGNSVMESKRPEQQPSPFLPKITMVGISMGEGQMSKANFKKTMEDLTKELERMDQVKQPGTIGSEFFKSEDRDPLFVANVGVGDYKKTGSAKWIRKEAI